MRSSFPRFLALVCAAVFVQIASDAWSQSSRMSGVGLIDFRSKPRFKVGDWVKYHCWSPGDAENKPQEYDLTMIISGEERFWGDDCFWVETWVGGRAVQRRATAMLMSYSIFGDSAWLQHVQLYQRKTSQLDDDGKIMQEIVRRSLGQQKGEPGPAFTILTDTLGTDTTTVPRGFYRGVKVQRKSGIGMVEEHGDSTVRYETWDTRTLVLSPKIPVTSLAKDVQEHWVTRKAWAVGHSDQPLLSEVSRGMGVTELVDYGSGGVEPVVTPLYARKPVAKSPASKSTKSSAPKKSG